MEYIIGFAIVSVFLGVCTILITLTLGGLMGMEVPSWGGLILRSFALGAIIAASGFIPIPFSGWIASGIGLVLLFNLDFPEDGLKMVLFVIALIIAQIILGMLLSNMGLLSTA